MKLETRHKKVIALCNYDEFITVDNFSGTRQYQAIKELYEKNKIRIGHWANRSVSIKLNSRITNYNKAVI